MSGLVTTPTSRRPLKSRRSEVVRRIAAALAADGFALLSTTELRGRTVLRLCTINPRTTEGDVRETVRRLERLGRELS